MTLPAGSLLEDLGIVETSGGSAFALLALDAAGHPTTAPAVVLTPSHASDDLSTTLTVPAGTAPGRYALVSGLTHSLGTAAAVVVVAELTVTAAPAAAAPAPAATTPAKAVVNAGLRSNTGWEDHVAAPADASGTPWLAVGGAAALLTAGGGALALARGTRRGARS